MKRWKVILITVSLFLLFGAVIVHEARERWKHDPQVKAAYREVIARQLVAAWKCIPPDDRQAQEEFVLSLMDRFVPNDRGIMEEERNRTQELERKAQDSLLTVGDREKIKTAYHSRSGNFEASGLFSAPSCRKKENITPQWWGDNLEQTTGTCMSGHFVGEVSQSNPRDLITNKTDELLIVYEDQYIRWELFGDRWRRAVNRELDAKDNLEEPWRYYARQDDLKRQAKAQIATMKAADVPEGTEETLIETIYRKLVCAEIKGGG